MVLLLSPMLLSICEQTALPMCLEQSLQRFYTDMKKTKVQTKIGKVMKEYGAGMLHSGSKKGPAVTSKKQAIAIALSEAGMTKKMPKKK
jgi:hypothetical protein